MQHLSGSVSAAGAGDRGPGNAPTWWRSVTTGWHSA